MYQEVFEIQFLNFVINFFATIFVGVAIKFTDDFLDSEIDVKINKSNFTAILGKGTMVYALFFLAIAGFLNSELTLGLFLASYIVGMFSSLNSIFPSRLNGLEESLIAFFVGFFLLGLNIMMFSVFLVIAVQLADDLLDTVEDSFCGFNNFACRFGKIECFVAIIIFTLLAIVLNLEFFLPVFLGIVVIYLSTHIWVQR